MPSRPITALIVLFWIGTMGWFGYREVWPSLFPSDAPPFVIELADEVTSEFAGQVRGADVLWGIYRGDTRIGRAETRLRFIRAKNPDEIDVYEMETRLVEVKLDITVIRNILEVKFFIQELKNVYRVTRSGELRAIHTDAKMKISDLEGTARFSGEVRDGMLHRTGTVDLGPFGGNVDVKLDPIEAPTRSILNPMHPVPKITGLRPGRRWQMPVLNPLGDVVQPAINAILAKHGYKEVKLNLFTESKFVNAEVLTETKMIQYEEKEYPCRIIEYRGDRTEVQPARTYVRISDGAVLRQEASTLSERLTLQRE